MSDLLEDLVRLGVALQALLVLLRLSGVIDWPWGLVLLPATLFATLMTFVYLFANLVTLIGFIENRRDDSNSKQ